MSTRSYGGYESGRNRRNLVRFVALVLLLFAGPRLCSAIRSLPHPAPVFSLANLDGQGVSVDAKHDGRSKLIVFWDSW